MRGVLGEEATCAEVEADADSTSLLAEDWRRDEDFIVVAVNKECKIERERKKKREIAEGWCQWRGGRESMSEDFATITQATTNEQVGALFILDDAALLLLFNM